MGGMKKLTTIDAVLKELGGPKSVADLLGYKWRSRVGNWRHAGLPPATFLVLQAALAEKRCTAPASLWRMPVPDGWTFRMIRTRKQAVQ